MSIKTQLEDEIRDEFEALRKIEVGSDTYRATVEGLTKLIDRKIEMDKVEVDARERVIKRNDDNEFKEMQLADDRKDRAIKNGLTVATLVITTGTTIWGILKSLKIEFKDNEMITSTVGKELMKKVIHFKK
nr:MAG TPA: hypothetical protein [Caudoviricetes sp.]